MFQKYFRRTSDVPSTKANFKNFKYANINIHHQHNNPYKTISKLERLNRLS